MRYIDLNCGRLSPIHWSDKNGVHADLTGPYGKIHVPYMGQTTLDMFELSSQRDLGQQLERINKFGLGTLEGW